MLAFQKISSRRGQWLPALLCGLCLAGSSAVASAATEPSDILSFLRVLRQRGYSDVAVQYFRDHDKDPQVPADLREVWDVELAATLWVHAGQITNEEQAKGMRAEAQQHLDGFMKKNPNHPAIGDALAAWGNTSFDQGFLLIRAAQMQPDKAQREKLLLQARTALNEASMRYVVAIKTLKQQLDALGGGAAKPKEKAAEEDDDEPKPKAAPHAANQRDEVGARLLEIRYNSARANYWLAQTYSEEKDPARVAALKSAGEVFHQLYQECREQFYGSVAHYWEAKVLGDSGDPRGALDFCDEVMAVAPNNPSRQNVDHETLTLIVDTMILQMQMRVKMGEAKRAISEAVEWQKAFSVVQGYPAYQGVALELIKMQIADLKTLNGAAKKKQQRAIVEQLGKIARIPGAYQSEASALRRIQMTDSDGKPTLEPKNHDEALAVGDTAAQNQEWEDALKAFEKALELLPKDKLAAAVEKKEQMKIRDRIGTVHCRLIAPLIADGKFDEAAEKAEKVSKEYADTSAGGAAAAIALFAFQKLASDPKLDEAARSKAIDRLVDYANHIIKTWPGQPEADDARIGLGQVYALRGDNINAIKQYISVSPESPRYGMARLYAGRLAWRLYLAEKNKLEKAPKPANPEEEQARKDATKRTMAMRSKAQIWLGESLEAQRRAVNNADNPARANELKVQRAETELLLAEICLEGKEFDKALALYKPMLAAAQASKQSPPPPATIRTVAGTMKAYVGLGDLNKAADLGKDLAEMGGDQQQINMILVELVKYLARDLQAAEAQAVIAGAGTDAEAARVANTHVIDAKASLAQVLKPLSTREQFPLPVLIYVGETCGRAGMKDEARALYQRILAKASDDPKTAAAMTRIRAALVGLLREEKKYPEALQQVETLLNTHPNAMDLLIQKGRIYQDWAKVDPKQYPKAVGVWSDLRGRMSGLPKKPPEYFEVVYNASVCLVYDSEQTKNKEKANQAEKLLKVTLISEPRLSEPDMAEMQAKYKVLLKKAAALQGR
ncbi:MAG: hypothetical protein K8T25_22800 [Planctomycetia bacterium]|nr:hypothetical protein [Planctomycetia bacterium]